MATQHKTTSASERRLKVTEQLDGVLQTMRVKGRKAPAAAVFATNRRLGKDTARIGAAAAETVELCPQPFRHVTTPPQQVREDIARIQELENCATNIEDTLQQVRDDINFLKVGIGEFVTQVYTATEGTLGNAFWAEGDQAKLRAAARPLLGAIDEREGAIRAATSGTRTRNSETTAKETEAQAEINSLRIENRFLAGEELRPADLQTDAPLLAARTARRTSGRARRTPRR